MKKTIKIIFLNTVISVLFLIFSVSYGWALLEKNIGIDATVTLDAGGTSQNNYMIINDHMQTYGSYPQFTYYANGPFQIQYLGTEPTTSWEIKIAVPLDAIPDTSKIYNCDYTLSNGVLTIYDKASSNNSVLNQNDILYLEVGFTTAVSNYVMDIQSVSFYTYSHPNPNLIEHPTECIFEPITIYHSIEGWSSITYKLQITNNTSYDFSEWEVNLSLTNPDIWIPGSSLPFNYLIKNGNLILYNLGSNGYIGQGTSTGETIFSVRFYSGSQPQLNVTKCVGKSRI